LLAKSRVRSDELELVARFVSGVEEALGTAEKQYEASSAGVEASGIAAAASKLTIAAVRELTALPDNSELSDGLWPGEGASQFLPDDAEPAPTHLAVEPLSDIVARFMNGAVVPCDLTRVRSIAEIRRCVGIATCVHPSRVRLYCREDELVDSSPLSILRGDRNISVFTLEALTVFVCIVVFDP